MPWRSYRRLAERIGPDDHFKSVKVVECDSDEEPLAAAEKMIGQFSQMEVWKLDKIHWARRDAHVAAKDLAPPCFRLVLANLLRLHHPFKRSVHRVRAFVREPANHWNWERG
jgi:hypothetical protein